MNLRGDNFTPYASVGFRRDNAIPLTDTSGALSTQADKTGHFTDTIIVGNDWGAGPHVITAEDSLTHKVASFPISVSGQGIVSRPPHLHLSVNTLDFGSGDQATNDTKTLMLLNSESSEISWQGSPSEPWLLITPNEGNFTRDVPQRVTVAVDRSKLPLGTHTANVHFSSNGGNESLAVSMGVTPLQPEHQAAMHISPAVLSFTAADGRNPTSSQKITLSNSGGQAMNWSASADVPWLSVSPPAMTVAPSTFVTAQVSVASRNLLPGTYTGTLTFTAKNAVGDGIVFNSPQRVVVSITVTPPCTLLVDPAMLDFSSADLQPAPLAKKVNVTVSAGCSQTPLNWHASSNAPWLKLNNTDGTTPGTLSIEIDPYGLTPNTYTGAVTVSSYTSTQTVVVRFRLSASSTSALPVTSPALVTTPASVNINVPGKTSAPITLANTGGSPLNWSAELQSGAPDFVSLSQTSGSNLARGAQTSFNVVAKANKAASGRYQTSVKITATNAANGQPVTDGSTTIPVTITISPPVMQVSNKNIVFSARAGGTVKPQSLTITNAGEGTLSWTVSSPKQSWLSISTTKGTTPAGSRSTLTFSIDTYGLDASSTAYTDQVVITPSTGSSVTAKISLMITNSR
jgi:hypothetical protein